MGFRYENQCCGCAVPGYPCRAPHCPKLRVLVYYYEVDGEELCEDCLKAVYKKSKKGD